MISLNCTGPLNLAAFYQKGVTTPEFCCGQFSKSNYLDPELGSHSFLEHTLLQALYHTPLRSFLLPLVPGWTVLYLHWIPQSAHTRTETRVAFLQAQWDLQLQAMSCYMEGRCYKTSLSGLHFTVNGCVLHCFVPHSELSVPTRWSPSKPLKLYAANSARADRVTQWFPTGLWSKMVDVEDPVSTLYASNGSLTVS